MGSYSDVFEQRGFSRPNSSLGPAASEPGRGAADRKAWPLRNICNRWAKVERGLLGVFTPEMRLLQNHF